MKTWDSGGQQHRAVSNDVAALSVSLIEVSPALERMAPSLASQIVANCHGTRYLVTALSLHLPDQSTDETCPALDGPHREELLSGDLVTTFAAEVEGFNWDGLEAVLREMLADVTKDHPARSGAGEGEAGSVAAASAAGAPVGAGAPATDPDSPPYASPFAYRAERRWEP